MLLFHGTTLPALDDILKQGLRPPQPHATAHDRVADISGHSQGSAVFLSTAPIAVKGGDPIAADLKRPDRQVIADAIPARYILGAIKVSDGARIVQQVRPSRRKGETLAAKLWTLAHALRAQYAGTPVLLD